MDGCWNIRGTVSLACLKTVFFSLTVTISHVRQGFRPLSTRRRLLLPDIRNVRNAMRTRQMPGSIHIATIFKSTGWLAFRWVERGRKDVRGSCQILILVGMRFCATTYRYGVRHFSWIRAYRRKDGHFLGVHKRDKRVEILCTVCGIDIPLINYGAAFLFRACVGEAEKGLRRSATRRYGIWKSTFPIVAHRDEHTFKRQLQR